MSLELDLKPPFGQSRTLVRDLHRQLREAILSGRLVAGTQLPPTRAFAEEYGISRSTTMAVYDLLLSEGFLVARQGSGTFVAANVGPRKTSKSTRKRKVNHHLPIRLPTDGQFHQSDVEPMRYDLRLGLPDKSHFRFDIWRRLSNSVLRDLARQPAGYFDAAGPLSFRRSVSAHVSFARAVACSEEQIVATTGAQQAFDVIARTLVESGKTVVAVEDPGYPPLRGAFRLAGADVRPVPVDDEGIIVDRIPGDSRIICVTPSHQFPTGVVMSLSRRNALLEFAERHGAAIVEDDYDSEFRFGGNPVDALQTLDRAESVFYVGTFSKSLFPALRLGFLVAPDWARESVLAVKRFSDWHGAIMPQLTLSRFIEEGHLARHVRRMRKVYGDRRGALIDALNRYCSPALVPIPSTAGLHIAVRSSKPLNERRLVAMAAQKGIGVEGIGRYALLKLGWSGLAFGYGTCAVSDMDTAIRQISETIGQC